MTTDGSVMLYRNIRYFRERNGMTQEELAKKVGYSNRSAITRIENGEIDLPQSKIVAFAKALGVEPGTLMGHTTTSEFLEEMQVIENKLTKDKISHLLAYARYLSENKT